jgi:hypothetical protein
VQIPTILVAVNDLSAVLEQDGADQDDENVVLRFTVVRQMFSDLPGLVLFFFVDPHVRYSPSDGCPGWCGPHLHPVGSWGFLKAES